LIKQQIEVDKMNKIVSRHYDLLIEENNDPEELPGG